MSPTDDDAVIIKASLRDPDLFAVIFDRHAPHVHRYLARRLGREAADDLVGETFLVAFGKRQRYDTGRADARPWLYGIATNLVGQHRRDEVPEKISHCFVRGLGHHDQFAARRGFQVQFSHVGHRRDFVLLSGRKQRGRKEAQTRSDRQQTKAGDREKEGAAHDLSSIGL